MECQNYKDLRNCQASRFECIQYLIIIYSYCLPKHMLWVLKRTVSLRRFFWSPKTMSYAKTRGQKYFNIALVLQEEWLTIFTRPALSFKSVSNKEHKGVICNKEHKGVICIIWLPGVILPKALILQDDCFGRNYSSFLDFTRNYKQTSGIFCPLLKLKY